MPRFPDGFVLLLHEILERTPRVRGGSELRSRARRRARATSGTFFGHRAYEPGEDLRLVDWNAYARSGELYTKLLEDDAPRALTLVVDRSASMGVGDPERAVGAARIAAIVGSLALARLDALHIVFASEDVRSFHGLGDRAALLRALDSSELADPPPLDLARAILERGRAGAICWISDFAMPERFAPALRILARHGRSCVCLMPRLALDEAPHEDGWVELVDPETEERERIAVDAALRAAMAEELLLLERRRDAELRGAGAALLRFPLPEEGDFRIGSWWPGVLRAWI